MPHQSLDRRFDEPGGTFPCADDTVQIPGPSGGLEALASCPDGPPTAAVAVICHPHPLHGGTMQNKVVHYLARTLSELGLRTVRFNFRGVGASAGDYAHGSGEQRDLRAVLNWVRERAPDDEIWLAGFSFGSYVALREAAEGGVQRLITVAPPVASFDFNVLKTPACPWLLLQGEADEVVSAQEVLRWAHAVIPRPEIVALPGVDHFFHRRLNVLREVLLQHLREPASRLARPSV